MMNIFFICGGVFVGFEDQIECCFNEKFMGFGVEIKSIKDCMGSVFLQYVLFEDLMKYGFILEFVGCFFVMVIFEQFDEDVLVCIFFEFKNSFVCQYEVMFEFEDVKLEFIEGVFYVIVCEVIKRSVGV